MSLIDPAGSDFIGLDATSDPDPCAGEAGCEHGVCSCHCWCSACQAIEEEAENRALDFESLEQTGAPIEDGLAGVPTESCETCDGTGLVPTKLYRDYGQWWVVDEGKCPVCDGTGQVQASCAYCGELAQAEYDDEPCCLKHFAMIGV